MEKRRVRHRGYILVVIVSLLVVGSSCKNKPIEERKARITRKGEPLTLLGREIVVGQEAPDFTVLANDSSEVQFSSFRGRICIISSVPSLDTPVCDIMANRFNQEAQNLGEDIAVLTISMDLPFAQKRWCLAKGVENLQILSDHRYASFGKAYGVLIKELRLLARAVFIVDKDGVVGYAQIVKELSEQPDYDAALRAVRAIKE